MFDTCREHLLFHQIFGKVKHPEALKHTGLLKITDGRPGTKPTKASKFDPHPDNHFCARHYACQDGGKTDALSNYSKLFVENALLLYKQGKFEMPRIFREFEYKN
jgi:hypothetical protein